MQWNALSMVQHQHTLFPFLISKCGLRFSLAPTVIIFSYQRRLKKVLSFYLISYIYFLYISLTRQTGGIQHKNAAELAKIWAAVEILRPILNSSGIQSLLRPTIEIVMKTLEKVIAMLR